MEAKCDSCGLTRIMPKPESVKTCSDVRRWAASQWGWTESQRDLCDDCTSKYKEAAK